MYRKNGAIVLLFSYIFKTIPFFYLLYFLVKTFPKLHTLLACFFIWIFKGKVAQFCPAVNDLWVYQAYTSGLNTIFTMIKIYIWNLSSSVQFELPHSCLHHEWQILYMATPRVTDTLRGYTMSDRYTTWLHHEWQIPYVATPRVTDTLRGYTTSNRSN